MAVNVTTDPLTKINNELSEAGFPSNTPPVSNLVVPNDATWAIPHFQTFAGIVNQVSRSYRYTFDEAMLNSPTNARIMRRDPVLMDALRARQIPTCQLDWKIRARDETDPRQMIAQAGATEIIKNIPRFQWMKMNLLEAEWFGRYGSWLLYKWGGPKKSQLSVRAHRPVMGDKFVFKFSGDVGVLVHPSYKGTIEVTDRGLTHFLTPAERETIVVHHFEPEDQDFYDFELAGAVEGYGIRGRLYWFWILKSKMLQAYLDYMQRMGLGIDVFFYQAGNPASLQEMQLAAQSAIGGGRLLLPRWPNDPAPTYAHYEASLTGARMFVDFISGYFDNVMRQYILGQTLSTLTGATGMGSGVAQAHEATKETIIEYDATALAETLTEELVKVIYRWTYPGVPYGIFEFDVEKPNVAEYMEAAKLLYEMGVVLDEDDLRSVAGIPKPQTNHSTVSKFQANQAASVGTPAGTPVMSPEQQLIQGRQGQGQQQQPVQQSRNRGRFIGSLYHPANESPAYDSEYLADRAKLNKYYETNLPSKPMVRMSRVHKGMDNLLARKHNKDNRRSWTTV